METLNVEGVGIMQIGVVTTSRADYGILSPLLRQILEDKELELKLFVSGSHLSKTQGYTVDEIYQDEIPINAKIPIVELSDDPEAIAKIMAEVINGFAVEFKKTNLDILIVMGDRYEMFAAAAASIPFNIPLAHLHGGELTFGSHDDIYRHAISKMAHIHFTSTLDYRNRLIQMGENPQNIINCGALSLDNVKEFELLSTEQIQNKFNISWENPPILVSLHPESHSELEPKLFAECVIEALSCFEDTIIFTQPNSDSGGKVILKVIEAFVKEYSNAFFVKNFGMKAYFSMMQLAGSMVGNSSSGIVEAPFFGLPVVNIGNRQAGRVKAPNIIETKVDSHCIREAIYHAKSAERGPVFSIENSPYGNGKAAQKIISFLKEIKSPRALLLKKFYDFP